MENRPTRSGSDSRPIWPIALLGAFGGAVLGAVIGGAIGASFEDPICRSPTPSLGQIGCVQGVVGVLIGAMSGLVLGVIVGALVGSRLKRREARP
jgi:hypothetical protein